MNKREVFFCGIVIVLMLTYFVVAKPVMMDDGFQYEGFAESLARGEIDFGSYYGFQGLSILSVPIYWLTHSNISIIITSIILSLLSIPLIYLTARDYFNSKIAGVYGIALFLLTPYPYATLMRGFQEAALLFFIILIIYGAVNKKVWTPLAWAYGSIVKPFALVLFPLFIKNFLNKKIIWLLLALFIGVLYLGINFYQTGYFVNNAAINSYYGDYNPSNHPGLLDSFNVGPKGFLRVFANLFLFFRKIMVSPLVLLLGLLALLRHNLKMDNEIIMCIILNIFLVGIMTFSFPKYLLPMTTLLSITAIYYLLKYKWLFIFVLLDSLLVFIPHYNYTGHNFWQNIYIFMMPFYISMFIYILIVINNKILENGKRI